MPAKHELRTYTGDEKVWVGKYRNSHNLPHWHRDCELLYVERGTIDVFCGGKSYTLRTGNAMYIRSGELHYMRSREETYLLVFIFDDRLVAGIAADEQLASPLLSDASFIPDAYARVRDELREKPPFYAQAANALTQLMMIAVFRGEKRVPAATEVTGMKTLKKLLDDEGIEPIVPKDEEFDPAFCEAIMCEPAAVGVEPGYVKEVFLKGYKKGDKVIRYAQVKVTT